MALPLFVRGETVAIAQNLTRGNTTTCGCTRRSAGGLWGEHRRENHIWWLMRARCSDPSNTNYALYGGRGITVCDRWRDSFPNFLADMGPRPSPQHTLDRLNTNGNYEPSNCRWATWHEQQNNRRNNLRIEFRGETKTLAEWADQIGLPRTTLGNRLNLLGWPVERALTTPQQGRGYPRS